MDNVKLKRAMTIRPRTCPAALAILLLVWIPAWALSQVFQEIYSFSPLGLDGDSPHGGLIQAKDGGFYGTTFYGGTWDYGTLFKMTPSGQITTLASLDATNSDQHPITGLLQASDGNFYCATVAPSRILRLAPNGALSVFGEPGGTVAGDLVQGTDGYIYVADAGDDYNGGFIFRFAPGNGVGELLIQFNYNSNYLSGYRPSGGLMQAADNNFYGVTGAGGAGGYGVVYKLTPSGAYSVMCSFSQGSGNAVNPYGRLLQASDGNFYGVAGGYVAGTIFKMTPDGRLTTFARFNGANGQTPTDGLIEANDGKFYGTTTYYGSNYVNGGTVFRLTADGILTALVSFSGSRGPFPGATPYAGLVQGSDGNLYGTCGTEGTRGGGTIFRIIMPGPLLSFSNAAGEVLLSWPTNYAGYIVQSATSLQPPNWVDSSGSPVVAGSEFRVSLPAAQPSRFFRLKR